VGSALFMFIKAMTARPEAPRRLAPSPDVGQEVLLTQIRTCWQTAEVLRANEFPAGREVDLIRLLEVIYGLRDT